jgi:hypothetical protein
VKTVVVLLIVSLYPLAAFAAEQLPAGTNPKLAVLLDAKDESGKPIINPEQRAYFVSLNDHLRDLLNDAVEKQIITSAVHLKALLTLQLRPQKMEVLLQNNCVLCHSDPETQSADTLFSLEPKANQSSTYMNLKDVVEDVHFRSALSCAGCHGGDPSGDLGHEFVKEWPEKGRDKNRAWVVQFCARCHSDPAFMHQFNPALPTDQLTKFQDSPHGIALLAKHDDRAPQCVSCHGVHGIRPAKDPQSKVYAQRVPATCGACHSDAKTMAGFTRPDGSPITTTQLADYRESVHGQALLVRGDLGAPACNDCHGNHTASPPGVASVSRSCSICHSANASLFDGSKHKQAFDEHQWAECSKCHGEHAIHKTHDSMLATAPGSLCGDCHRQYAKDNPECMMTAEYFRKTIAGLDEARTRLTTAAENLAAKGLDVEPINDQLTELTDTLKRSRTYIHSFSHNTFAETAKPGEEAVKRATVLVKSEREEYKFRQTGLAASIALIGLLMLAIYLKLRQLEK